MVVDRRAAGGHQRRAAGLRRRRQGGAGVKLLNRRDEKRVADAVIRDPEEHTRDRRRRARCAPIQAADLTMPAEELEAIWSPTHLERLARTYWKYLSRVTLGLIRVAYTADRARRRVHRAGRSCCCASTRRSTRWTTSTGSCAGGSATACSSPPRATRATATSRSTCTRCPADDAWPRAAARRGRDRVVLSRDRVPDRALGLREHAVAHPRAGHARLPALARAARARGVRGRPLRPSRPREHAPVNVGDTPWAVVGALAGLVTAVIALLVRRFR